MKNANKINDFLFVSLQVPASFLLIPLSFIEFDFLSNFVEELVHRIGRNCSSEELGPETLTAEDEEVPTGTVEDDDEAPADADVVSDTCWVFILFFSPSLQSNEMM